MSKTNIVTVSGISTGGLLFVTLVVAKLAKVIDISWFWVISPLWLPWAVLFVFLMIYFVCWFILETCESVVALIKRRRRNK
jgi:hypothetical protein